MVQPLPDSLTFAAIKDVVADYLSVKDIKIVEAAYTVAYTAHLGQFRKSGRPYIQHPLHVALTLAQLHLDAATLAAAFLHDVVEDTKYSLNDIRVTFGWQITNLVDGVTKLDKLEVKRGFFNQLFQRQSRILSQQERRIESLRKMLLATSKDVRVVLIKLADRLHNMETLAAMEPERQYDIAKETLEIYAPLAYRLGIGTIKGRLEDLAFPFIYPEAYQQTLSLVKRETIERERHIKRAKQIMHRLLGKAGIQATIQTRVKHLYSLYRKMQRYNEDISQIFDLVACRIIVDTTDQCYQALGLIHQRWKPYEGRVKDYIATPKPNGYQSLHTTVKALSDKPIEVQIRSKTMHDQAEFGIAAHWHYSEQKSSLSYFRRQAQKVPRTELAWVNELARWQRLASTTQDFDELVKIDFFGDRIFVYTPKGDVIDLPVGSTPIDFAYAIHSEIGDHLSGAKVNGKMLRLQDELRSGDTVELLVAKKSEPKRDWLSEARTASAKAHIRRALRRHNTH